MTSDEKYRNCPALTDELSGVGEMSVQTQWIDRIMTFRSNVKNRNVSLR